MEVEYLIITKRDDEFCTDLISFENLLSVDTSLEINRKNHTITDKSNKFTVKYKVECYDNQDRSERVFDLLITAPDTEHLKDLSCIVRKLRKIVIKINPEKNIISVIRNDIGRKLAIEAYPYLFDIENLMRRLIYRFMFINVGMA